MFDTTEADDEGSSLKLRSEAESYRRVTLEEWREATEDLGEELCRLGNKHRIELIDGAVHHLPKDVDERGYFEDSYRGIAFLMEHLEDPTWETLIWSASMHCGGTFESEALDKVVRDTEGDFGGDGE